MRKALSVAALLLVAVASFAQSGVSEVPSGEASRALDVARERSRIQLERAQQEARYQAQVTQCYTRFAVTECIRQARLQQRAVMEPLRRQEVMLNDAERQRKAQEQLTQIKEKAPDQRTDEEAVRRLEARQAQQEREERAAQKAAAAKSAPLPPATGAVVKKPVEQGRTPDEIAKDQAQYTDKLKEAEEHRASRLKSNSEKAGAPSKSLPLAP